MEPSKPSKIARLIPALIVLACSFLIAISPKAQRLCIYDRHAILQGDLWRVYTGHFVHFSMSHLLYDASALFVAVVLLEKWRVPGRNVFLVSAPLAISLAMMLFEPNLEFYGGLSGVGMGAVTLMSLHGLISGASRWPAVLALAVVTLKCATPGLQLATFDDRSIRVAGISHIAGTLFAGIVFAVTKLHCLSCRERRLTFSAR